MNQEKKDKSDSDNDTSSDSKSETSSDSDSESGSGSSSSSSSENSQFETKNINNSNVNGENDFQEIIPSNSIVNNSNNKTNNATSSSDDDDEEDDDDDDGRNNVVKSSEDEEDDDNHDDDEEYNSSKSSLDDEEYTRPRRNLNKRINNNVKKKSVKTRTKKKNTNSWNSGTSESESDSDVELPSSNRRNVTKSKPTKRKTKNANYSSDYSDSDDEKKRSASRRAATATVSYKEASDDDKTGSEDLVDVDLDESPVIVEDTEKFETIERIIAKRHGKHGVTGNQTTIYAVEENGDPNEGVDENDSQTTELQFFIKWKNWSHIHNTWESEASLIEQKVKGMKKLENYIKRERDIEQWRRYAGPEDIDYYECQLELQQELLKSYNNVDRIISQAVKLDGSKEYYCKWESLPYADATWEDSTLVAKKWLIKINEFNDREQSKRTPSRHCKALKYRPKFHHIKSQPEYLGLKRNLILRDYQMEGLNWLILSWCKENSVILADEMGLGKTIQTICFLYYLFETQSLYGPFLCVVPLSTMTAWQREFAIWAPEMNIVTYLGDVQSRSILRQYEWSFESSKRLKFNAILTTYEILLKDQSLLGCLNWAALLVDEAHRLKNDDSLLYKALKSFNTNFRLLITGTPLQNSLKELWALLHFIMPQKFETWEQFEIEHGNAADKGYTKLHKQLEPYILRRVKKDVEKSLPAKVEQILRVEMTSIQKQYYKWILTKNFHALRKGTKGSMSTFLNIVIELKKCCNHAILIRQSEYEQQMNQEDAMQSLLRGSGKLVLLDKLLCKLRETGHRVLIFSQMVRMLDILAEYLQKRHFPFQRLDGSIKGEIRKQALDHFNAEGSSDFCFLLSTRAGGLGINLATADTVIIFDSDWNPQNDLQAQARAHRIGQKNQVNIYRLVTARSVEEQIVEKAKRKMVLDHLVIQRMDTTGRTVLDKTNGPSNTTPFNKEDLSAILKFGAEELFKDEQENDDDLVCDIDEILRRAETRDEAPTMAGDELLSAFKVASFAAFDEDKQKSPNTAENDADGDNREWEEIIPENFRKALEHEERQKESLDSYLPPRRKMLQQLNQVNDTSEDGRGRKRRKQTEDESEECSDGSGDDRPKKRGRPPIKEKIYNFTDTELRRFIRSYKKFPTPLKRLEAIACDAELQEKPLAELKKLGEMLHARCVTFLDEHSKENDNDSNAVKKRGARGGFSVKFGGVSFNAKTLMSCEEELQPLDKIIPGNKEERMNWILEIVTRPANFDVDWTVEDDSKLLIGIYEHGIGSWEAMKMDPSLGISDKILSNDNKKPQSKHLQSRAEYLLKLIRKNVEFKKGGLKQKRQRKTKDVKPVLKEGIEHEDISSCDDKKHKKDKLKTHETEAQNATVAEENSNGPKEAQKKQKSKHKDVKKNKKKNADGPMHFTANNEPRALNVLGDLDPSIFNECKEKMRPVKKALKALDNPDQSLSNQEQVNHTRACLLSIGKQIEECLSEYKDVDKIKEWRSNLWYFVSKFTEFDAKKLFKLYKHAVKRSDEQSKTNTMENSSPLKDAKETKSADTQKHLNNKENPRKEPGVPSVSEKDRERERRERKDKKKHHHPRERETGSRDKDIKYPNNDVPRDDSAKRRLEEGECEPEAKDYKRMHNERSRERDYDDRKKWEEYPNTLNNASRVRRNSNGSSPIIAAPRGAAPTTPQRIPLYAEPRDGRPQMYGGSGDAPMDRWAGGRGDGNRFNDHKRERYENYNRLPQSGYHRERDHRDRDRDRDRRLDKRRYPPGGGNYPNNHYMPSAYYQGGEVPPPGYRERYGPPPGSSVECYRDRDYLDYRYERRPPPANS